MNVLNKFRKTPSLGLPLGMLFSLSLFLPSQSGASAESLLPSMESRLSYLEQQVRSLTGQVEELNHTIQVLEHQGRGASAASASGQNTGSSPMDPEQASPQPFDTGYSEPSESAPEGRSQEGSKTPTTQETPKVKAFEPQAPKSDAILPEGPIQVAYDHATSLLNRKNYGGAERAFREITRQFPDDPLVINAYYWLGETHYKQHQYAKASVAFGEAYQIYRRQRARLAASGKGKKGTLNNTKASGALLKLSLSLKAMGQPKDACAALGELYGKFPHMRKSVRRLADQTQDALRCPVSSKKPSPKQTSS